MADLSNDVVIVGGEDNTIITVEREVSIVTVEVPVEIHSSDSGPDVVVVAADDSSIVTEEEVVSIVTMEEEVNVIADVAMGPQGIQGEKGDTGAVGPQGIQGDVGPQGIQGDVGPQGATGLSAYEVAVTNGFVGTEAEWLLSIVGPQGIQGIQGIQGEVGPQGIQGIQGLRGESGVAGDRRVVWILDAVPTSTGIVGQKTYRPYISNTPIINTGTTDTYNVKIMLGAEGGADSYSPVVTVNGVTATLTESSTPRWFTGYANIVLVAGDNVVTATSDAGDGDVIHIVAAVGGPAVNSVVFGAYPGTQTQLKQNDVIGVTITTESSATQVVIAASGACKTQTTLTVTAGVATGTFPISALSGNQSITVTAKNSMGTPGDPFVSSTLVLNQTYPSIGAITITYNAPKLALSAGESGLLNSTVTNFDTIGYTSPNVSFGTPTTYSVVKSFTNTYTGYVNSGTNVTITANRAANNATSTATGLIKIATTAPTAAITFSPAQTRLVGSPTGIDYTVVITPSQELLSAPTLNASAGTWQGAGWTLAGSTWTRSLRISDSTAKGAAVFSGLTLTNIAQVAGTSITSGSTYTVGGFTSRTLTFPAFSRVAPLGTNALDQTKTSAQIVGGNVLTRYTDNAVHLNGYYFANADATYNATGSYLGLSDSAFAGSNTTGTLQVSVQETA